METKPKVVQQVVVKGVDSNNQPILESSGALHSGSSDEEVEYKQPEQVMSKQSFVNNESSYEFIDRPRAV